MAPNVVVIGSYNVTLIMKVARLPEKGESMTEATFTQTFGSKG